MDEQLTKYRIVPAIENRRPVFRVDIEKTMEVACVGAFPFWERVDCFDTRLEAREAIAHLRGQTEEV